MRTERRVRQLFVACAVFVLLFCMRSLAIFHNCMFQVTLRLRLPDQFLPSNPMGHSDISSEDDLWTFVGFRGRVFQTANSMWIVCDFGTFIIQNPPQNETDHEHTAEQLTPPTRRVTPQHSVIPTLTHKRIC